MAIVQLITTAQSVMLGVTQTVCPVDPLQVLQGPSALCWNNAKFILLGLCISFHFICLTRIVHSATIVTVFQGVLGYIKTAPLINHSTQTEI